ncbi:MAG TPA: response regulator [Bryobacteraceae bacterium]|nr:response regulator [Bryobacteraceae bacterium]
MGDRRTRSAGGTLFYGMGDWAKAIEALFPGERHGILTAVFSNPDRWWGLVELADYLEVPPGSLRRDLVLLAMGGVLLQRRDEQDNEFRANPGCPFFAEIQAIAAKCASLKGQPGAETILVVEDEPATLKISRILLESWGYHVLEAHSPDEAIGVFEANRDAIRLMLTDVVMPGMSGPELGDLLRGAKPELKILYMSGYPHDELVRRHVAFLPKPFNPAGLARKIREELDKT